MARVPDFKRLSKEDFPNEYRDLISRLALPINSHIEQVRNALNGNLDFTNLKQELKTLEFTTGSNGQPLSTVTFKSNLKDNVSGMIVARIEITSDNTAYASQMPVISWTQANDIITVTNIGGLLPGTGYRLNIITI